MLIKQGIDKNYELNYIEELTASQYADIYMKTKISPKISAITK
jgi:hypothetical protein